MLEPRPEIRMAVRLRRIGLVSVAAWSGRRRRRDLLGRLARHAHLPACAPRLAALRLVRSIRATATYGRIGAGAMAGGRASMYAWQASNWKSRGAGFEPSQSDHDRADPVGAGDR